MELKGKSEGKEIIYLDPKQPVNKRVEDLLKRMTLGENETKKILEIVNKYYVE